MSKQRLSLRLSAEIREEIEAIKDRESFDSRSEATREVLRRGIEYSEDDGDSAGEQLTQVMTGVAAVGAVVASLGVALGQTWSVSLVIPFWGATFLSSLLWASVRTLEGRDLW